MKTIQELNNRKVPIIDIDPALDKYRNKVTFPKKLAKANEMLKTAKLPTNRHSCVLGFEKGRSEQSSSKLKRLKKNSDLLKSK